MHAAQLGWLSSAIRAFAPSGAKSNSTSTTDGRGVYSRGSTKSHLINRTTRSSAINSPTWPSAKCSDFTTLWNSSHPRSPWGRLMSMCISPQHPTSSSPTEGACYSPSTIMLRLIARFEIDAPHPNPSTQSDVTGGR
ncbi:aspartate transaminase [Anopheles sinensis]|uniref:Aspartate transaminase n=1 Tax=Anopheles sinensis TaxID=74873 RepID=A0A084VJK9_ANOSI|nr:aspartate transaminase [Anopheles sinensis]